MSETISERDLQITFTDDWIAIKWDECAFRKRREQYGKAADIVAVRGDAPERGNFVFEIKDYPDHPLASVHAPKELAAICVEKVRDTLAQLIHSPPIVGRPDEEPVDSVCRAFGSTDYPLNVVVWIEDANDPPLEITELQEELERAFRWLPTRGVTAATADDLNVLSGVSARRAS